MRLTPTERAVLSRRASGMPIKEIAFAMQRSPKTIEFHWAHIKEKVGLGDVVAVCRWAWLRRISNNNTVAYNNAATGPVARGRK